MLEKLQKWFFWFRVQNWRVSFLLVFLIILLWSGALSTIPKESSPDIKFGIISINTVYPGVNPVDMDNLITEEVEAAIDDIEGIKKIESSSRVWVASTTVTLENDADTSDVIVDIKAELDKIRLPDDAEDPLVVEISSSSEAMFEAQLSGPAEQFSRERLLGLARVIKDQLSGKWNTTDIDIWGSIQWWAGAWAEFDIHILVDQPKAEALGMTPATIASQIRAYNQNSPLGNFEIDGRDYDFRIDGELLNEQELLDVPLRGTGISDIRVRDIATLSRKYDDTTIARLWSYGRSNQNVVSLVFNKTPWSNIFTSSDEAKAWLQELISTPQFAGATIDYSNDLWETIREDYATLGWSGIQTLVFVFLCLLIFVGFKEASIATFSIPLAFLVTFVVLQYMWLSLNFLTNFSLVLTLGIAIDTTIVIVEAAYENLKLWYRPKSAVLLAVRDFRKPLIAGTCTTLVVFIPMMVLPGVTGKFLAYIPITVFVTLIAALFISLTVNSALFYKLSKNKKRYVREESAEQFLTPDDRALLELDRVWKTSRNHETKSFRQRMLDKLWSRYAQVLKTLIGSRINRRLSVLVPFFALIATFVFLSPRIWFTLFPAWDNGAFNITVETAPGTSTSATATYLPLIESVLSDIPETKVYTLTVSGNRISGSVELLDKDERDDKWMRDVFVVESDALEKLWFLEREWLKLETLAIAWWPPAWSPVGIKLLAEKNSQFWDLVTIAKEFAAYLRTVDGTKNVSLSTQDTPGQFVFTFNQWRLQKLWLSPTDVTNQLFTALNGFWAWSVSVQSVDADIKVLYEGFSDEVTSADILATKIQSSWWSIVANEILDVSLSTAVWSLSREDTKLTVKVESDLAEWFESQWPILQANFVERAESYDFPDGISYNWAGESDENADLISAAMNGLVIAVFMILVILVLQFNSFGKPAVILYSVFLALLWVNIWLFLTGNPYSMPMGIGFIALTGIVVNDAIIFLDRINQNVNHDVPIFDAIIEAGRSRLQPIILTTLTTLLGVLPIALQDPFWEWLGFTMISGLFAWSAMTLFVIPCLYYMVFGGKKKNKTRELENIVQKYDADE